MPRLTLWQRLTGKEPDVAAEQVEQAIGPGCLNQLVLNNRGTELLEVMVEMTPDRYVLKPGDRMIIEADLDGAPFDITPFQNGLQIYPGNAFNPHVTINGVEAESDWSTPTPNSQ